MEKRVYSIPVTWEVCGVMKVEASSYKEAKELVYGDAPLPTDPTYVDGSILINEDMLLYYYTPKTIKVESAVDPYSWYRDQIGKTFEVVGVSEDHLRYIVNDNGEEKEIWVNDCEILV